MEEVVGKGIAASERDFRVARALDAEGGVVFGRDVDIIQRHVESVIVARGLVDDSDDVVGDVFGCVLEVFRSTLQDRGRFVPGLFVVIGAGDLEGCTGVRELAFGRRAVALCAFRAFGRGGSAAGLGVVFLVAGGVALRAGGAPRAFRAFGRSPAAGGGSVARLSVAAARAGGSVGAGGAALRAGGAALRAGGAALRAGGAALRAFTLRVRASRTGVLAVGGVAGLVLFRGLGLVFLAAAVRRVAALGVAGVGHVFVFVFAVFYFERGRRGFGGRGCRGAALDYDVAVVYITIAFIFVVGVLDIDVALFVFGDGDVTIAYVIGTRIRRCGHAGHHCGCQRQRRHPVERGPGGVCRHPQRMPQNAHCELAVRNHRNLL